MRRRGRVIRPERTRVAGGRVDGRSTGSGRGRSLGCVRPDAVGNRDGTRASLRPGTRHREAARRARGCGSRCRSLARQRPWQWPWRAVGQRARRGRSRHRVRARWRQHRHGRRARALGRRAARRQQRQRVVVGVAGPRVAHAEVQVRLLGRADAGGADRADALSRRDPVALAHGERGQVQVRGVVGAVGRADAHGDPGASGRAGEAHVAAGGRDDRAADGGPDVDAAVLAGRVGVVAVAVGREHLTVDGPGPGGAGIGGSRRVRRGRRRWRGGRRVACRPT